MAINGRVLRVAAFAALACAGAGAGAGCRAASNLDERPIWAKSTGAELPATHPRAAQCPPDQLRTDVAEGRGSTVDSARGNAEGAALRSFGDQILSQVTSRYESQTNTTLSGEGDSMREASREDVRSEVKVQSQQFLSSVKAIDMWDDGYSIDPKTKVETKHAFGAYVLDRDVAGDQGRALARRNIADLESIAGSQLHEQSAKDVIKKTFDLELAMTAAQFFGKPVAYPSASAIKRTAQDYILQAGGRREASGDTRQLEEALALYEFCAQYDAGGVWSGRALAVKRNLPCLNCNAGGLCVQCGGTKGKSHPCDVCSGSLVVREKDPACNGTGEQKCLSCNGQKTALRKCTAKDCQGGKEQCPSCKGQGQVKTSCTRCRGSRTVTTPQGQQQPCGKCAGLGFTASRCGGPFGCGGSGKVDCRVCGGDQQEEYECPKCRGTGRLGQCERCGGAGKIESRCRACSDGTKWVACSICSGSGNCAVCKGRKNRM